MLSQAIPWLRLAAPLGVWAARGGEPAWDCFAAWRLGWRRRGLGPVRLVFHQSAGCEGSRVDPGAIQGGSGTRRIRRALRASGLGRRGCRLRRQRPEIDQLLARHAPYSEERDHLSTALFGASEILKVDAEGRVVLSETIKAITQITQEVNFLGKGDRFQIWEPRRFQAHFEEAKARSRVLRKQLGSQSAAPDGPPPPHGARE